MKNNIKKYRLLLAAAILILSAVIGRFIFEEQLNRQVQLTVIIPRGSEQDVSKLMEGARDCAQDYHLQLDIQYGFAWSEQQWSQTIQEEKDLGSDGILLLYPERFLSIQRNNETLSRTYPVPVLCYSEENYTCFPFGYALFLASVLILCVGIWKIPLHQSKQMYKVGIAVYDLDDSFMNGMTKTLEQSLETRVSTELPIRYEVTDAKDSDNIQQRQIQYLINQHCDLLLLNLVKSDSAADILNQVQYVGTDGEKAGILQANMLQQLWETQQKQMDKNQNNKLDYILIEGEQSHYDTIRRTNALSDQQIREAEAIVCSNDDMALGAYDFYQQKGLTSPIILGINKTDAMKQKIDDGEIYGTVDINPEQQVQMICDLINQIAAGSFNNQKIWYAEPRVCRTSSISWKIADFDRFLERPYH